MDVADDTGPYTSGDNPLARNGVSGNPARRISVPALEGIASRTPKSSWRIGTTLGVTRRRPGDDLGQAVTTRTSPTKTRLFRSHGRQGNGASSKVLRTLIQKETNSAQFDFLGSSYMDVLS